MRKILKKEFKQKRKKTCNAKRIKKGPKRKKERMKTVSKNDEQRKETFI